MFFLVFLCFCFFLVQLVSMYIVFRCVLLFWIFLCKFYYLFGVRWSLLWLFLGFSLGYPGIVLYFGLELPGSKISQG